MPTRKNDKIEKGSDPSDEIKHEVGQKIQEIRKKLDHSALRIAKELGVSREAITHIENGRNNINAVALWKLAVLFNCDVSDFFPTVPDGYSLTRVDLRKLAQEDERAAIWAEKLFKKK